MNRLLHAPGLSPGAQAALRPALAVLGSGTTPRHPYACRGGRKRGAEGEPPSESASQQAESRSRHKTPANSRLRSGQGLAAPAAFLPAPAPPQGAAQAGTWDQTQGGF